MKKILFLLLFLSVSTLFSKDDIVNMIVCTINGDPVTMYDLKKQLNPESPESVSADAVLERRAKLMDIAINQLLVDQELERQNLSITESEVDNAIRNVASQNSMTLDQLQQEVTKGGISWETYKKEVLVKQLKMLKLKQVIATKQLSVDDALLREMYKKQYTDSRKYTASHILIRQDNYEMINGIYTNIQAGKISFEEAARQYSNDGSAAQGGSLGTFYSSDMVPAFAKVLQDMKEGEISQPFKSRFGWHIIKLNAVKQGEPVPYEKVKMSLMNRFYIENQQKAFDSWLASQKALARVICFNFSN
ncbi:peptidylprolyl isomerase [bacterium]|nr:peptidylprolyl isomerase [bacterium]